MKYWTEYRGHEQIKIGKRKAIDNTIYTFDIETSSYIILNNKQYNTIDYLKFTQEKKDNCIFQSSMYIWMFGINDTVYYGRTWKEFLSFLQNLDYYTDSKIKKYIFIHNLRF